MIKPEYVGGNLQNNFTSLPKGTLVKTHPKSFFMRYNLTSKFQKALEATDSEYVVLQSMVVGHMEVLSELVYRKYFEIQDN